MNYKPTILYQTSPHTKGTGTKRINNWDSRLVNNTRNYQ